MSRTQKRLAVAVLTMFAIATAAALPFARDKGPPLSGFVPAYQMAVFLLYAVSVVHLTAHVLHSGSMAVLHVAAGCLFSSLILVIQMFSFPIWGPTQLVGSTSATTSWLWTFWHLGPTFSTFSYVTARSARSVSLTQDVRSIWLNILLAAGGVIGVVAAATAVSIWGVPWLPVIVGGDDYRALTTSGVGPLVLISTLASMGMLVLRTRCSTAIELWLAVSLALLAMDDVLTLVGASRLSWGWYAGRAEAAASAAVLLCFCFSELIRHLSAVSAQTRELHRTNTELEQLTENLARAREQAERASRAKTRFLAGISHELRTPLNGIMGYAQLLHMEGGLNAGQAARVEAMLGAGTHLLEMINSVLDLSQIETEQVEIQAAEVDLRVVAAACLDLVRPTADAKQLALRLLTAPDVPRRVMTDPVRLRQVLLNLMGNAVKFTVKGSVELRLRTIADGTGLRLEVADTGPGIPPEHRAQLFQDFQRLGADAIDVEGAGLGLALSTRLAVLMGGSIGQEENPLGGSLFWLDLPLLACSAQSVPDTLLDRALVVSVEDAAAKPAPVERSLRILVVDDVAMNRDIASSFLRSVGHDVACTEDGAEALKAAETNDFDVILMDVRMPGMDGLEATRRIRALAGPRGRVPIVALTAQAFVEQVEECRRAGMESHLAKPFTLETLCAAVTHAAAKASSNKATKGGSSAPAPLLSTDKVCPGAGEAAGIGAELPVLDRVAFERTTAYLAPEAVASYLRMLSERCEVLLRKLRASDALKEGLADLAPLAHTLAGSAGMFGFQRLAETARAFERAIETKSPETLVLVRRLVATIEVSVYEMRCNTQSLTAALESV